MAARKQAPAPAEKLGVIYARYSSHNQRDESIEQQVAECTAFAEQAGIRIVQIYADRALSGRSDKRPQFQRMMRDAERGGWQTVIAYKSNRIARNMLHALQYENRLAEHGVQILYAKEEFGNTAAGRFALRTMMNVNQFYSENMGEDIRRGMRDNAENCKVNGPLPYGYVKGADGRYEIEPAEAEIVREIYRRVISGEPHVRIYEDLNARGLRTKLGKPWGRNSFHRLLNNDNYIGVYHHSGVLNEHGIPPILTLETWQAMRDHLEHNASPRGRRTETADFLLTGKLFCGLCREHMVGITGTSKSGAKHHYYACSGRRARSGCRKENVRQEVVEAAVVQLTRDVVLQDDVILWIADNAVELLRSAGSAEELAAMRDELASDRKAIDNIMAAIEAGIFTATTRDRLLELEAEVETLEGAIASAKAAAADLGQQRERLIYALQRFRDGDPEDQEYRRTLFETFVRSIYLYDDRIEISYYYAGTRSRFTIPLEDGGGVRNDSPVGHHRRIRRTQAAEIVLTASAIWLVAEFARSQ